MSTESDVYYCNVCHLSWTEASPSPGWGSDCPRCGTQILSGRELVEYGGEDDGGQAVFTVVLAGTGATAAVFLKTIAEEAAKDIYAFLKTRLKHGDATDPGGRDISDLLQKRRQASPFDGIRIVDEQLRLTLELPSILPDKAWAELSHIIEIAKPIDQSWVIISYKWGAWRFTTYHLRESPGNPRENDR